MNNTLHSFVLSVLSYSVVIPGAAMCIVPVAKYLKFSKAIFMPLLAGLLVLLSVAMALIDSLFPKFDANYLLVPVMLLLLVLYFLFVNVDKIKLLFIFLSNTALLSFPGLINHFVESQITPNGHPYDSSVCGLFVQLAISTALAVLSIIIASKPLCWLIDNFNVYAIWYIVCIVPIIVTANNIVMIPVNYSTMSVGRVAGVGAFMVCVVFLLFMMFQLVFYFTAKTIVEKNKAERISHIYKAQAEQYEAMKNYMESTRKLRHDFKHTATTAIGLAREGKTTQLVEYLNSYSKLLDNTGKQFFFCKNSVVNAILGYYAELAFQHDIKTDWRVNMPEVLSIDDVVLSAIIGNVLENALEGCLTISEGKRYIKLQIDVEGGCQLYIIVVNNFDGKVKKRGDVYLTNKANGSGLGIMSVKVMAEKYTGQARFSHIDNEFYSEIMLDF